MLSRDNEKWPVEILIVDDEPQAVKYFQRVFSGRYTVLTATSAAEAEKIIFSEDHEIGVVITDQRMPGRSGVSLLSAIRERRPDIVRILTTAYADLDSALQAVNSGEIFRYITKPWDLQALEADLEQATTFYIMQREHNMLLNEKFAALQRTLLRDRINSMAAMSAALAGYKNAKATVYHVLKDSLAETSWRPAIQRQWAQIRSQENWRLPLEETQRLITISERLTDAAPAEMQPGCNTDLAAIVSNCARALHDAHDMMSVSVFPADKPVPVALPAPAITGLVQPLMEAMSKWAAVGSTVVVQVKGDGEKAMIDFEVRNFDGAKAVSDSVLHAPPYQPVTDQAVAMLRAALAVGHLGGTLNSPPSQNGFKQLSITLPASPRAADLPANWLADLNDDYEDWVLDSMDLAS